MGLEHLPAQSRFNDPCYASIFNNTWGHCAPQKNVSYKGIVRFVLTDHSAYGCQPIILQYEFPNLEGPYIHDELFEDNWLGPTIIFSNNLILYQKIVLSIVVATSGFTTAFISLKHFYYKL